MCVCALPFLRKVDTVRMFKLTLSARVKRFSLKWVIITLGRKLGHGGQLCIYNRSVLFLSY